MHGVSFHPIKSRARGFKEQEKIVYKHLLKPLEKS